MIPDFATSGHGNRNSPNFQHLTFKERRTIDQSICIRVICSCFAHSVFGRTFSRCSRMEPVPRPQRFGPVGTCETTHRIFTIKLGMENAAATWTLLTDSDQGSSYSDGRKRNGSRNHSIGQANRQYLVAKESTQHKHGESSRSQQQSFFDSMHGW